MSKVFEGNPNIVKIEGSDSSGSFERYIVGFSLDEVIEAVTLSLDGAEQAAAKPAEKKSHRKPRRTKAEMAAATEPGAQPATTGTSWP